MTFRGCIFCHSRRLFGLIPHTGLRIPCTLSGWPGSTKVCCPVSFSYLVETNLVPRQRNKAGTADCFFFACVWTSSAFPPPPPPLPRFVSTHLGIWHLRPGGRGALFQAGHTIFPLPGLKSQVGEVSDLTYLTPPLHRWESNETLFRKPAPPPTSIKRERETKHGPKLAGGDQPAWEIY